MKNKTAIGEWRTKKTSPSPKTKKHKAIKYIENK